MNTESGIDHVGAYCPCQFGVRRCLNTLIKNGSNWGPIFSLVGLRNSRSEREV